ncbi:MAG: dTMP kinase [Bdellovibrionales bacterium]
MKKGLFITLEGGEGAGKTTQIKSIEKFLKEKSIETITTREPGGTPEAEKIRNLLVDRDGGNWSPEAETLLFFTARHMHLKDIIHPALEQGKTVICDRFTDSTRAYQCYGHGLNREFIEQVNRISINGFSPDLTFILDIPVKEGLLRSKAQNDNDQSTEDRFENMDLSFHEKLRAGFLDIAKKNRDRCHVIDALQTKETITEQILSVIEKKIEEGAHG